MEVIDNVGDATLVAAVNNRSASADTCDRLNRTEICIDPSERTPLLCTGHSGASSRARSSTCFSLSHRLPVAEGPSIYATECINWRTIGLLLMFVIGVVLAGYLLWQQSSSIPHNSYKLNLIRHDIWSGVHLNDQSRLQPTQVVNVFITHTASEECSDNDKCASLLCSLQRNHLEELPFNFLLAGDCFAYEARGWQYASSFGELPQASSLVLAFVGDFSRWLPSGCQLQMAKALIWESQRRRKLQPIYQLYALRNVSRSVRDADALHRHLQLWPLYTGQHLVN